jgi:hypothetical protein
VHRTCHYFLVHIVTKDKIQKKCTTITIYTRVLMEEISPESIRLQSIRLIHEIHLHSAIKPNPKWAILREIYIKGHLHSKYPISTGAIIPNVIIVDSHSQFEQLSSNKLIRLNSTKHFMKFFSTRKFHSIIFCYTCI